MRSGVVGLMLSAVGDITAATADRLQGVSFRHRQAAWRCAARLQAGMETRPW